MDGRVDSSRVLERFTWFEPEESDEPDAEVDALLKKLDQEWQRLLEASSQRKEDLIEIFLQLGRRPKAIFDNGKSREAVYLTHGPVCERAHIDRFIQALGWQERLKTSKAKSLCLPMMLHRFSFITKGVGAQFSIIGINIRIGRSVTAVTMQMCPWLLNFRPLRVAPSGASMTLAGKSALLIGRPGSGKTTLIREIAQALSQPSREGGIERTVVVVDKINEIAGDYEAPHACIGEARWMPCASPEALPQIMKEAVDNGNPDVVLVDELWSATEVEAACDISERGVSLIATVHGNTLFDTLNCSVRQALLGGVTVVDKFGSCKRAGVPAFDLAIELHQKDRWILHPNIRYAVDTYLRGEPVESVELRPGLAITTLGIPLEDRINYCESAPASPHRVHAPSRNEHSSPTTPVGTLGRLPCSASIPADATTTPQHSQSLNGTSHSHMSHSTRSLSPSPSRSPAGGGSGRRESRNPRVKGQVAKSPDPSNRLGAPGHQDFTPKKRAA